MNKNQIKINETVYELQRVYAEKMTVADIIKNRLSRQHIQSAPLTDAYNMVYNTVSEAGMSKEVK